MATLIELLALLFGTAANRLDNSLTDFFDEFSNESVFRRRNKFVNNNDFRGRVSAGAGRRQMVKVDGTMINGFNSAPGNNGNEVDSMVSVVNNPTPTPVPSQTAPPTPPPRQSRPLTQQERRILRRK